MRIETMKMLKSLAAAAALATSFTLMPVMVSAPAEAAKAKSIELTQEQSDAVGRINAFFNSFKTMRGDFIQKSEKGRALKGVMFISKPGKLRFEFAPPTPLLIASDGKWVTFKNTQKERGDQWPLSSTPFRFIVSPELDLMKEAVVTRIEQVEGFTTVGFADKKGSLKGEIAMVYDETRGELAQWVITDNKGVRTTVILSNIEKDVKIDPKLFQVTIKRKAKE
jgi:outer membrane lipoprotein-sorting protein